MAINMRPAQEAPVSTLQETHVSGGLKLFIVIVLFFSSDALIALVRQQNGIVIDVNSGDPMMQVFWFIIYFATLALILLSKRKLIRVTFSGLLPIWLLVAMALLSALWSEAPAVTLRQAIALIGTTLFGLYVASRCTPERLLSLVTWTLGIMALLSLFFAIFLPEYGIHTGDLHNGAWRGIFVHKNNLGRMMVLSASFWYLEYSKMRKRRLRPGFFLGLSLGLMLMSRSVSAIVALFVLFALLPIARLLKSRNSLAIPALVATLLSGGLILVWFSSSYEAVLTTFGRDATLTGRVGLWVMVWQMIQKQPWLGYGYSGFWLGPYGPSAGIWTTLPGGTPHAHNGFLDLWLQLGVFGVAIFLMSIAYNFKQTIFLLRKTTNNQMAMIYLTFLSYIVVYDLSENALLVRNSIFWILYVAVTLHIWLTVHEIKISAD